MEHAKSSAKLLGKTKHDGILWEDYGRLSCMQWCLMQMRVKEVLVSWGDVLADQKSRGESTEFEGCCLVWMLFPLLGSALSNVLKCYYQLDCTEFRFATLCSSLFSSLSCLIMWDQYEHGQGRCWPCQCCQWFLHSQLGQRLPCFAFGSRSGQRGTI